MAATAWRSDRPLDRQLREDCSAFDFYQLVRLLSAGAEQLDSGSAQGQPWRQDTLPRFVSHSSWAFPTSEVVTVAAAKKTSGWVVKTPNYCIAGYLGPLPEAYTEWMYERSAAGDGAMEAFLNLFNEGLNQLRYKIKARARLSLNNAVPEQTELAVYLGAIQGRWDMPRDQSSPLDLRTQLALSGLRADCRSSAAVIESILAGYLKTTVEVAQLAGGWHALEPNDQGSLGVRNSRLGDDAVLGRRVWHQEGGIEVHVGPVDIGDVRAWIPGGARHKAFVYLLRYLVDGQVDCLISIKVNADTVPLARLAGATRDEESPGLRLSYTAWLKTPAEISADGQAPSEPVLPNATFMVRGFAANN